MTPTPTTPSLWKQRAAQAKKEGYMANSHWERQLGRHLRANFPALVAELEATGDLEAYMITMTHNALTMVETLIDQGTDPAAAQEAARAELLRTPAGDDE